MTGASPQAGFSAEELERALMNLRRAARGTADDTGAIRCLLDYLSTHTAHVAAASQAVRGPFRAVFTVPTPCWTAQALADLCHEEAGTAPDGPVGAEFALYLAGTLDHNQVQAALETLLREAWEQEGQYVPVGGDDVAELQQRLSALGFDSGRVDGIFGDLTSAALGEFQRDFDVARVVGQMVGGADVQAPADALRARIAAQEEEMKKLRRELDAQGRSLWPAAWPAWTPSWTPRKRKCHETTKSNSDLGGGSDPGKYFGVRFEHGPERGRLGSVDGDGV